MTVSAAGAGTLVLDIGKTHAKLLLLDGGGVERWRAGCRNAPQGEPDGPDGDRGYLALGIRRLHDWLDAEMAALGRTLAGASAADLPARLITTTHGAAFVPLGADGPLLPPLDYEWDGLGEAADDGVSGFDRSLSDFAHHGTPRLPLGLNGGRQIDWLLRHRARALSRLRCWLPYPQYWAWWFSGVVASEVSSLGCHTGLWCPTQRRFSNWALASGVAARFAPLRAAWDTLGPLRPELASRWRLPGHLQVLTGAHDSNACLALHMRAHPEAVVVSSGTWTVVMAPGGESHHLRAERDELVNVAVDARAVPTARFMGGREFDVLCGGADPALATQQALHDLLQAGWHALPSWSSGGGRFAGRAGKVMQGGSPAPAGAEAVPKALRPALASLYCARMCALLVQSVGRIDADVIVDGPLAQNEAFRTALAAALGPGARLMHGANDVEGTAKGAWRLAYWHVGDSDASPAALAHWPRPEDALAQALAADDRRWQLACEAEGPAK